MNFQDPRIQLAAAVTLFAILAFAGFVLLRRWRRHRARRGIRREIESVASASLTDVLVPDGSGGKLHLDFLLLTARGFLVVDLREVTGVVFGGEQMREWAVMNGIHRWTFPNPLEALYDRLAAVRQLAGEVPVEGRIVFTNGARFTKGRPPLVVTLNGLASEFPPPDPQATTSWLERYRRSWDELVAQLEQSPLGRR